MAYVSNTTDLNPETWHTVFSRFCNEDRKEIGDIDIDVSPSQRDLVYEYIINRFGQEKTAFILAIGTIKSKGCIDEICRGLGTRWNSEHQHNLKEIKRQLADAKEKCDDVLVRQLTKELDRLKAENEKIFTQNPWVGKISATVKKEFESDEAATREKYPDVFYYYDGLLDVAISQSMQPTLIMPTVRKT